MIVPQTAVRSIRRRPKQALMMGLAIALATAFAASSILIAINARAALVAFGMTTPEATDVVVVPPESIDNEAVAHMAGQVAALPETDEVAVEYLGDVSVEAGGLTSTWKLTSDPGSGSLSAIPDLEEGDALQAGEIYLGVSTAERSGVSVGDTVVAAGRELVVAGIGQIHEFGMDVGLITEEDAVAIGSMTPVQIFIAGDMDPDAVSALIGDSLVISGEEQRADQARTVTDTLVGVFGALTVFVGLALLSAVVIVGSTFRTVFSRRATELALLRCVGAGRAQLRRLVLFEAACIGLLSGIVGVAVGWALAAGLVAVAQSSGLLTDAFNSAPLALVACLVLATLSTVVAALPAAKAAGKASPIAALSAARATEARSTRRAVRLVAASVLALSAVATGAAGAIAASTDEFLALGLTALSGVLLFVALVCIGPFIVQWFAALLRPLTGSSGAVRVAVSNARRSSRRTAAMSTVLMLGVGLTAALVVGVAGATADAREDMESNFSSAAIIPVDFVDDPDAVVDLLTEHPAVDVRVDGLDILIDPAPGTGAVELRSAVLESVSDGTPVFWASDVREGIEQTLLIGQIIGIVMISVTLIVAMVGVMVTLALSVAERREEIALTRALGMTRAGARRSLAIEAALAATLGSITGVVFGSGYGLLALNALGMSAGAPPIGSLTAVFFGVIIASILAAAIPMRTAGRVSPAIGMAAR